MSLDGISMYPLSLEINQAINGGRVDKINQPNKQSIILSIRQPGKNLLLHISITRKIRQSISLTRPLTIPRNHLCFVWFCESIWKQLV